MNKFLRRTLWCLVATTTLLLGGLGGWLWLSAPGMALRSQVTERSPSELVRHLQRRLQGHTRLEAVLRPPLDALQRRIEPEPPLMVLSDLGKGQRRTPTAGDALLPHLHQVDTPQAIRQALLQARPGTDIVVSPGIYPFSTRLRLGHDGTAAAPIRLRAERPGTVWFEFAQEEGVLVDRPHWRFENLDIRGVCSRHHDCEHAFHVVGRGHHVIIRNNRLADFNAAIKVNGWGGDWPDHGELSHNTLHNTAPRRTARPVTMFDLVGANHWRVLDNHVSGFAKEGGNRVAYGLFAKGASEGARFERNLVICSPRDISAPGVRVGISFGGGGTDPGACRDGTCRTHEHRLGLAANNVVAHCNDVGLDVNRAHDIVLVHNTLVNTAGIGARGGASVQSAANLLDGGLYARDDSHILSRDDRPLKSLLIPDAAAALRWQPRGPSPRIATASDDDFAGHRRPPHTSPGAMHFAD